MRKMMNVFLAAALVGSTVVVGSPTSASPLTDEVVAEATEHALVGLPDFDIREVFDADPSKARTLDPALIEKRYNAVEAFKSQTNAPDGLHYELGRTGAARVFFNYAESDIGGGPLLLASGASANANDGANIKGFGTRVHVDW